MTRPDPTAPEPDSPPLEQALARLEEIARTLERGDLPLEESLALFEEGVALSRRLESRLAEAEMKIEVLTRRAGGQDDVAPFEPPREEP